jgi:hypothetical protein
MLIYQMVNTDITGKYYDLFPPPKGPPGRSKLTTSACNHGGWLFWGKISFEDMGVEPRKWCINKEKWGVN